MQPRCSATDSREPNAISFRSIEATPIDQVFIKPSSVNPQLGANACIKNTTSGCR
jgi:hypothetical protein